MKYRAIRDSHGYQGRYWSKGDEVDVPDGAEKPPVHFVPLTEEGTEGAATEPSGEQPAVEQEPEAPPEEEPAAEPAEEPAETDATNSEETEEPDTSGDSPKPEAGKAQTAKKPPLRRNKKRRAR